MSWETVVGNIHFHGFMKYCINAVSFEIVYLHGCAYYTNKSTTIPLYMWGIVSRISVYAKICVVQVPFIYDIIFACNLHISPECFTSFLVTQYIA